MTFNVEAAKQAGYSDKEIEGFLAKDQPKKFNTEAAKKAGYSDKEIEGFLAKTKQEPLSLGGAAQAYASGFGGGAGGGLVDVANLVVPQRERIPGVSDTMSTIGDLIKSTGLKGSHELTKEFEGEGPQNALERILQHSGNFGGQEALLGGAVGGPAGAGIGGVHGSISGAFYGAAKELGASDEVALLAALATLSPVANQKLSKIHAANKAGKLEVQAAEKLAPKLEKVVEANEGLPPSGPSEPPPPGGIGPGSVIPETKSAFEEKEAIIQKLHEVPKGKELGIEAELMHPNAEAPSLQGRVSEAPELGEAISKEPFQTEAQAGRSISHEVTAERDIEREIVRDKYKRAEEVTTNHDAVYPKLAKENMDRLERLESLEKRSAGEEAVYQDAVALKNIIGTPDGLYEANASKLMKQANSFSQKVKYELPYAGYKGEIKKVVHEMNEAVIESLEKAGKQAELVRDADKTFGRFADRFMNKEISPYFQKKTRNPELLARQAIADNETYRAVKAAIGSRDKALMNKIDREVVHASMDKYAKDPSLIGSKEYVKDLSNLQQKIGKEKIAEVDLRLREKAIAHERKSLLENKIKESEKLRKKEVTPSKQKEIAEKISGKPVLAKTPEEIDKLFRSRSDIRKLRTEMRSKGLEKEFERLKDQKIEEIFKEGGFGEKKITGTDLKRIVDKEHEVLFELLGEKEVSVLYKAAEKAGKQEVTEQIIKEIAKATGKLALQYAGLGKVIKLLPLRHI